MPKPKASVVVDKPIQVLAPNGEPVMTLFPVRRKKAIVCVEFDGTATVTMQSLSGMGLWEEELHDVMLLVEAAPDNGKGEDE